VGSGGKADGLGVVAWCGREMHGSKDPPLQTDGSRACEMRRSMLRHHKELRSDHWHGSGFGGSGESRRRLSGFGDVFVEGVLRSAV
jgi:hypothetical protein